jgi:tRNA-splicing ligase RtcB
MKRDEYDVLNVEGGRPVKMWTKGVPVKADAKRQLHDVSVQAA